MILRTFGNKTIAKLLGISTEKLGEIRLFVERVKKCDSDIMKKIGNKIKDYDENQLNDFFYKIYDIVK